MQELGQEENQAPCLQGEAAYTLRLQEAGLVKSLKGCLHAVLCLWWVTGCCCKTKPREPEHHISAAVSLERSVTADWKVESTTTIKQKMINN